MGTTTDNTIHLTVDIVLFAVVDGERHVLLIRRGDDTDAYPGWWALPGGYVDARERIEVAARRELAEETNVTAPDSWRQVGIYDAPDRDPRGRVVSVAYVAELDAMVPPTAGDDARDARWVPVRWARGVGVADGFRLAFDHEEILRDALAVV